MGRGKVPWNKLCDASAWPDRTCSGLGAMQTREVAYLDMRGLPYEEHDVSCFGGAMFARLCGSGLGSTRISFPGRINVRSGRCIVSFPGKYSKEWDQAVWATTNDKTWATNPDNVCSLACVFLTQRKSGLGQHAKRTEFPGRCWCQEIYGGFSPHAFLSILDMADADATEEKRALMAADALALGKVFLVKDKQNVTEWEQEESDALEQARLRCCENGGRAPWGCQWFEECLGS